MADLSHMTVEELQGLSADMGLAEETSGMKKDALVEFLTPKLKTAERKGEAPPVVAIVDQEGFAEVRGERVFVGPMLAGATVTFGNSGNVTAA